ncbi:MAG TPA: transposase zinc-binding domain-containing protein [Roseiarcus sp.]|nr:transposase zinc-binding domain-containing protein [Roseiarcus sp.]
MGRPRLEVADVFRAHGAAWRKANAGHVSLAQLKVMSAIETCRTAALGGHVERCEDCARERVAYNSCRNRHCPKCQGAAARQWLMISADFHIETLHHRRYGRIASINRGDRVGSRSSGVGSHALAAPPTPRYVATFRGSGTRAGVLAGV